MPRSKRRRKQKAKQGQSRPHAWDRALQRCGIRGREIAKAIRCGKAEALENVGDGKVWHRYVARNGVVAYALYAHRKDKLVTVYDEEMFRNGRRQKGKDANEARSDARLKRWLVRHEIFLRIDSGSLTIPEAARRAGMGEDDFRAALKRLEA